MALRKKYSRKANILGYELPKGGGGGGGGLGVESFKGLAVFSGDLAKKGEGCF